MRSVSRFAFRAVPRLLVVKNAVVLLSCCVVLRRAACRAAVVLRRAASCCVLFVPSCACLFRTAPWRAGSYFELKNTYMAQENLKTHQLLQCFVDFTTKSTRICKICIENH